MHDLVVNRPKPVEVQSVLVVFDSWLHLKVGLVANNMVHFLESDGRQDLVEFLGQVMGLVARQEGSFVF